MRILLVYDHLNTGGAQTHGLGLSQALIRAGHEVAVASRGGSAASRFAGVGVACLPWPAPQRADLAGWVRAARQAGRVLRDRQPDVIHAHAVLPGLLFSFAARRANGRRAPVIVTPHRSWRSLYRFPGGGVFSRLLYAALGAGADEVVAISEGMYRELTQHGIPPARCHLIRNGVDLSAFDKVQPPNGSPPIVGTVGRLIEQKGVEVYIDAAARAATEAPDVRFLIAGDGPLRENCERRIATLGLNDRVLLLGEPGDVPSLLAQMSVFVSASRWEGMPYALLEALAARRPVVATSVPGTSELIADGVHGLLVPPDDAAALSAAILRLLNDPERARLMGFAGRQLVEARYNLPAMVDEIAALYARARAGRAAG